MTSVSREKDELSDFDCREITLEDAAKRVYISGTGPAVIVMTEMPGISPHVARFARWVRDAGFTVYMPSLFGNDGAVPTAEEGAAIFQKACVSAEFRAFANQGSSPVTKWLRALARLAHAECGGPGVGVVGGARGRGRGRGRARGGAGTASARAPRAKRRAADRGEARGRRRHRADQGTPRGEEEEGVSGRGGDRARRGQLARRRRR